MHTSARHWEGAMAVCPTPPGLLPSSPVALLNLGLAGWGRSLDSMWGRMPEGRAHHNENTGPDPEGSSQGLPWLLCPCPLLPPTGSEDQAQLDRTSGPVGQTLSLLLSAPDEWSTKSGRD